MANTLTKTRGHDAGCTSPKLLHRGAISSGALGSVFRFLWMPGTIDGAVVLVDSIVCRQSRPRTQEKRPFMRRFWGNPPRGLNPQYAW